MSYLNQINIKVKTHNLPQYLHRKIAIANCQLDFLVYDRIVGF